MLAGSSTLTKAGAGTLTFSGINDYSGGTTINAGTLKMDLKRRNDNTNYIRLSANAIGASGTLELFNTNTTVHNPNAVIGFNSTNTTSFTVSKKINKTVAGYIDFILAGQPREFQRNYQYEYVNFGQQSRQLTRR